MRKVAPEIDELMWSLAEARDPQALDEFGQRHPDMILELGKRLSLTAGLRGAAESGRPSSIPRFTPRPMAQPIWARPLALAAAATVLSALAIGSFMITRDLPAPEPTPVVSVGSGPIEKPRNPVVEPDLLRPNHDGPSTSNPAPPPQEPPFYMQPHTVEVTAANLPQVLDRIGQECGLEITMPDVPADLADIQIEARYYNRSGMDMLNDLGSKYGFTAFSQGGNKVLIVPAREGQIDASTGQ